MENLPEKLKLKCSQLEKLKDWLKFTNQIFRYDL